MEDKKILKMVNKDGIETDYEILCAFQSAEYKKNYVIYTDNSKDNLGNLNIYASIYYPGDNTRIDSIETDKEWELIENMLKFLKDKENL